MSAAIEFPAATTRPVVLLGDPVAHSRSPALHNTAFRALGLDLVYLALRVDPEDLGAALAGLAAVGCAGANVTVPHKAAAAAACDELTDEARLLGVTNTLWWRDGRLHGTNTDATGLARALADAVEDPAGQPAVVVGTGGAARAAVVALARSGARVTVVGRRPDAADDVAALAAAAGGPPARGLALDAVGPVRDASSSAAVLVNATTLGMGGEDLPPQVEVAGGAVVHDLVYGHGTTPFVARARAAGADAHDGTAMLVAQAEDAFEVWTGRRPPAGLMRSVVGARGG